MVGVPEVLAWLGEFNRLIDENADRLTRLDAAIGDADHGTNMRRGMTAVVSKVDAATLAGLFKQVGMTLVSTVGGASGPLFGTFFLRMSTSVGEVTETDLAGFAAAVRAGLAGVVARGKAVAGDKTMYDALAPAADALETSFAAAYAAAEAGRDATIPMQARKGRASYLGERSVGHQDPGATTVALLFEAAARTLS